MRRMERRSLRRRTVRRQNCHQGSHSGRVRPLPPSDVSGGEGYYPPPPNVDGQWSYGGVGNTPHIPISGSSTRRAEMVARIRAERRNIAPEALTRHHLKDGDNSTITVESPKAEEGSNFVSGLIKRLSDQTRFELVRDVDEQNVQRGYSNLAKLSLQKKLM